MAVGDIQNQNDTPIGGASEYRGNLQSGDVFGIGSVPAWDGKRFVPALNSGLLSAYGGLASSDVGPVSADGTPITNWEAVLPYNGTPLGMTVSAVTGEVTVGIAGVYRIDFDISLTNLANNTRYDFFLGVNGAATEFGAAVAGSGSLSAQSSGFSMLAYTVAGVPITVIPVAAGDANFGIVSATLSVTRIG